MLCCDSFTCLDIVAANQLSNSNHKLSDSTNQLPNSTINNQPVLHTTSQSPKTSTSTGATPHLPDVTLDQPSRVTPPMVSTNSNNYLNTNLFCSEVNTNLSNNNPSLIPTGSILNLSKITLTPGQISVLEKGLSFCPSKPEPDLAALMRDVDLFFRSIRREAFFQRPYIPLSQSESSDSDLQFGPTPFDHHQFKDRSNFDPVDITSNQAIDTFQRTVSDAILTYNPEKCYSNLNADERSGLKELISNTNLIIKPADKGSCIVIMDKDLYTQICSTLLSDTKFYKKTDEDLTNKHNIEVGKIIQQMVTSGSITEKVAKYLHNPDPRTARFYILPKIHKNKWPPPGRPIVSATNSPTERISGFVDHFLQPFVCTLPAYIQDTNDFLRKIESQPSLPENAIIASLDVVQLYTNILTKEALSVARSTLATHRPNGQAPTNTELLRLLALVLKCNNFEFNGDHYLQTNGVAMGSKVSPTVANLVMGNFEHQHVYPYRLQPSLWVRFIDDIYLVWLHGLNTLLEFVEHLNSVHESLKFTLTHSTTSVQFLDTTVNIDDNRKMYTTLYTKPTDTHMYLDFRSCHPIHTKTGGPYGQFLRIKRICSLEEDFQKESKILFQHYLKRGYPHKVLKKALNRAKDQNRTELLNKTRVQNNTEDKLFCIVTHHPSNPPLKQLFQQYWKIITSCKDVDYMKNKQIIIGQRRDKNLRDVLVSARMRQPKPTPDKSQINPAKLCKRIICPYCIHLDKCGKMFNPRTGLPIRIPQRISCEFNNLVYLITCKRCNMKYVGETKNRLRDRFQGHFRDIKHGAKNANPPPSWNPTSVSRHFNSAGHSGLADVKIQIIELIPYDRAKASTDKYRGDREYHWIITLITREPHGMNVLKEKIYKRS